ncbi:MAG: N-acetylglucosamine kinase [Bacteroidetes bacterium SW_9_63_38]|nr:MAG: N-acetylglucosamine kinase [Bacteroidetes bacterium SW_9_63_38]
MGSSTLLLGLDVGGSRTRLRGERSDEGESIEREGPGANPNRVGEETAVSRLSALVDAALAEREGIERLVLAAGISGAGSPSVQSHLAEALDTALARPGLRVHVEVVHDGIIALDAAYDTSSGVIVIAGTGSLVLARTHDGTIVRAGGWGPQLGDDGSGHALGRAGLRAVAEALDGGRDTTLRDRVFDAFALNDRTDFLQTAHTDALALPDVAPIVVAAARADDSVAARILHEQVSALARQLDWLKARTTNVASRLTVLGGLTTNEHYDQALRDALRDCEPDGSIQRLESPPVLGALRRARRLVPEP